MSTLVPPAKDAAGRLWPAAAFPFVVLWVGLPVLFAIRRLAGGFSQPLPPLAFVAVALVAAAGTRCLRSVAQRWFREAPAIAALPPSAAALGLALPALPAVLLMSALTLPGTGLVGALLGWLVLLGSEAAAWSRRAAASRPALRGLSERTADVAVEQPEEELPPGLLQQMTRVETEEGQSLHVLVRVHLSPGDQLGVAHLSFCPPLAAPPQLAAHAVDVAADVRLTHVEAFGARIEVRLPQPAAATQSLLIEVFGEGSAPFGP
jgi:hypothetical protein